MSSLTVQFIQIANIVGGQSKRSVLTLVPETVYLRHGCLLSNEVNCEGTVAGSVSAGVNGRYNYGNKLVC